MAPKQAKTKTKTEAVTSLTAPNSNGKTDTGLDGLAGRLVHANRTWPELVFGVARIFASFNDTFVHITDLRFVRPGESTAIQVP